MRKLFMIVALLLALALLSSCSFQRPGDARKTAAKVVEKPVVVTDRFTDVQALTDAFAARVHAEVTPKLDGMDRTALQQRMAALAEGYFGPNIEMLKKEARKILAALPKFELGDPADWQSAFPDQAGKSDAPPKKVPSMEIFYPRGILLISLWNPVKAADGARQIVLGNSLPIDLFSKYMLVESLAPPRALAANADPAAPEIALVEGDEVFLVKLTYSANGYYLPQEVRWLRRRAPAPKEQGTTR